MTRCTSLHDTNTTGIAILTLSLPVRASRPYGMRLVLVKNKLTYLKMDHHRPNGLDMAQGCWSPNLAWMVCKSRWFVPPLLSGPLSNVKLTLWPLHYLIGSIPLPNFIPSMLPSNHLSYFEVLSSCLYLPLLLDPSTKKPHLHCPTGLLYFTFGRYSFITCTHNCSLFTMLMNTQGNHGKHPGW